MVLSYGDAASSHSSLGWYDHCDCDCAIYIVTSRIDGYVVLCSAVSNSAAERLAQCATMNHRFECFV